MQIRTLTIVIVGKIRSLEKKAIYDFKRNYIIIRVL